jgi:homopolymeric O-antigen transport system permease protein
MSTVRETPVSETLEAPVREGELPELSDRVTVIRPASSRPHLDLRELWVYRELAATFAWRDLKVRYKQSLIGVAWAIIQPVMTMIVFTFIFGTFAKVPSQNLPYPVFSYSGILPWTYFASALGAASASLAMNSNLVTKIYFPRVLLPLAAITVPAVDFVLASSVLFGLMTYYSVPLGPHVLLAPVFMLLAAGTALGVGLFFAVANVRYRDVPYAIPFIIQIWLFLSPVIYPIRALHQPWERLILSLNPMSGVITGFRWSLVGTPPPSPQLVILSVVSATAFLVFGLAMFRRSEPRFADTI